MPFSERILTALPNSSLKRAISSTFFGSGTKPGSTFLLPLYTLGIISIMNCIGLLLSFRSALVVLVVAAPPEALLVAPLGGAVEPLVHAPEAVHSSRIGGIGVVDHTFLERERAHARSLAR